MQHVDPFQFTFHKLLNIVTGSDVKTKVNNDILFRGLDAAKQNTGNNSVHMCSLR